MPKFEMASGFMRVFEEFSKEFIPKFDNFRNVGGGRARGREREGEGGREDT